MYERNIDREFFINLMILIIHIKLLIKKKCEAKGASKPLILKLLKKRLSYLFVFYTENITYIITKQDDQSVQIKM